jgi:putative ubiquitin-RnfH superfamily antitoxin RatB of RatAB toxin-antitoxin module
LSVESTLEGGPRFAASDVGREVRTAASNPCPHRSCLSPRCQKIAKRIDGAECILKADIARMKKLLADRGATLPPSIAEAPLQEARESLDRLAVYSRQVTRWQQDAITDAERVEVVRLRAIIPEIRPLIQRFIALATELDKRAKTGAASPRKKWRH